MEVVLRRYGPKEGKEGSVICIWRLVDGQAVISDGAPEAYQDFQPMEPGTHNYVPASEGERFLRALPANFRGMVSARLTE